MSPQGILSRGQKLPLFWDFVDLESFGESSQKWWQFLYSIVVYYLAGSIKKMFEIVNFLVKCMMMKKLRP